MVIAIALQSIDLGSIPVLIQIEDFKTVFTASLLGAQHKKDDVEKKPAGSPICLWIMKALYSILPLCGR